MRPLKKLQKEVKSTGNSFRRFDLVDRCPNAFAGLRPSNERLNFDGSPVNRLTAYAAQTVATPREWAVLLVERRFAHSIFDLGDLRVEIGEEAQIALKDRVLDLVGGKVVTTP